MRPCEPGCTGRTCALGSPEPARGKVPRLSFLLSDIEAQSSSILFWRSMTQWLGGIGIVVLFVAVAPVIGAGAARLLGAEVSGLTQTRLTPRIADTAKALLVIYLAISLAETMALMVVGMSLYDAV